MEMYSPVATVLISLIQEEYVNINTQSLLQLTFYEFVSRVSNRLNPQQQLSDNYFKVLNT